ncbi:MAG: glucosamine-6-phosphate deaminase [Clostridiaceae bacterium]|nr:glucosamine-6-phosphate deaminase [Clostridiaceae bacterium]
MRIIIVNNKEEMGKKAASLVSSQIILKPDSVLGLATGGTPLDMYKELIRLYNEKEIDFKLVKTFNLDEYFGIGKENDQSYYYYMVNNLFKFIDIPEKNINIPDGSAKDIVEECVRYEKSIKQAGGIDIQVLGIGTNGHIGFNEPDVNFEAQTHLVKLEESTIQANSIYFKTIEEVPTTAVSMGIKTIMNSRKIVLLANGISKAEAIYGLVNGKINPNLPASILQLHPDVTLILDKDAASKL